MFFSGAAFSAVADSPASVEKSEFEIKGVKIGDELTDEFFERNCPSEYKNSRSIECKQKVTLRGIKLSVLYFFYDAKLLAIFLNYPSSQYEELIDAYTKKFDQSPFKTSEKFSVSTGDEYTNQKSSWDTGSGKFVIEQYSTSLKKGSAHLLSGEYEKYVIKKKEEINPGFFKKIFGDFFD